MTLFANSGISWPNLEQKTSIAGKDYFESISAIFKVFAQLEYGENFIDEQELRQSARVLEDLSRTYHEISDEFVAVDVESLSNSEIELAAIQNYIRPYRHDHYSGFYELFSGYSNISMRKLYLELSERIGRLSSAVITLKIQSKSTDLAPQIFTIFQLLESISIIARVIAVVGRRQQATS